MPMVIRNFSSVMGWETRYAAFDQKSNTSTWQYLNVRSQSKLQVRESVLTMVVKVALTAFPTTYTILKTQ